MSSTQKQRRHDERGIILPITVVLLSATLALSSFVIDIGGDRVVRRDMQSVADVVALDLARSLDGRTAGGYNGYSASGPSTTLLAADKSASVQRQGGLLAEPDTVAARLAVADPETGVFQHWASASEIPNSVRVYATGSSAFRIFPTTPGSEHLQRSALAVIGRPIVCISAGATLADLTPGGTLDVFLGKLIGLNQLSVVSPSGIASLDALVPLGQLATQLNVGTVDQLINANVTTKSFLIAAATVLSNNGNNAAANVLNAIAAKITGAGLAVGSILNLNTSAGSAADLNIDAFSLAQAVIQVANKTNAVNIGVPVTVPGLANIELTAKVIEAPQIACGPVGTRARSAQIEIGLKAKVTALGGLVASAAINPLSISVADGYGTVSSITCSVGASTVGVNADTAVGRLRLNLDVGLLLGLTKLEVGVPDPDKKPEGAAIGHTANFPLVFNFPAGSTTLPPGQVAGSGLGNLGLSSITPLKIDVIGLPVGGLLGGIVQPLLGLIDPLLSSLLNPVLESLGIRLGTVKIAPTTRPACNEPALRD